MIKDCNQKPAENRHLSQDGREKRGQTDQWDSVSAENATLLETLRALAPVVTPGTLFACGWGDGSTQQGMTNIFNEDDGTLLVECIPVSDASAICLLRNALPAIIAALETVALIRDEDWLEERISDSLDMDWRPIDAARAIIAGLEKETA